MIARLDRYVATTVLGAYLAALVFLVSMFVVFDLLFEMDTYVRVAETNGIGVLTLIGMLLEYHLCGLPFYFVTIAPFVTVIATMFALSRLMAANEVVPMIFTGRSMFRILGPMLGIGVLSAVAMGLTWQWIMPNVAEDYEKLKATLQGLPYTQKEITLRSQDNPRQELYIRRYDSEQQLMRGIILYNRGSARGDGIYLEAAEAQWSAQRQDWKLVEGLRRIGEENQREIVGQEYLAMPGVTPNLIMDSVKGQKQTSGLSYTELLDLIKRRPGKDDYVLALHVHFTFPLANLILLLLALPFAVNYVHGRRIERVVFAIVICAGYLVMDLICQNLVFSGFVNPIVAAWTPTIVFGSLGVVVFGGMRT